MSKVISELGLTVEQTRLLFSYQYLLNLKDVDIDKNENKKKLKKQWLQEWKKSSEDFINKQRKIDDKHQYLLTSDFSVLKKVDPVYALNTYSFPFFTQLDRPLSMLTNPFNKLQIFFWKPEKEIYNASFCDVGLTKS